MFGLGSKKPPSLTRFPEDTWAVAPGEHDGRPLLVRVNSGCHKFVGHPELPCRLGLTITFRAPEVSGFPGMDEQNEANEFEDRLVTSLQNAQLGFLVAVITTGGKRELVLYVREQEKSGAIVDEVIAGFPCQACYGFHDDPDWSYFAQLT